MRRSDMESRSPHGYYLPSHPGVIKAFQDIVRGAFGVRSTGKFVRSGADKCTSSVLSLRDRRKDVSTAGINSRQKERERKTGRPVRYHYRPHPRFLPRCRACSKLFAQKICILEAFQPGCSRPYRPFGIKYPFRHKLDKERGDFRKSSRKKIIKKMAIKIK